MRQCGRIERRPTTRCIDLRRAVPPASGTAFWPTEPSSERRKKRRGRGSGRLETKRLEDGEAIVGGYSEP